MFSFAIRIVLLEKVFSVHYHSTSTPYLFALNTVSPSIRHNYSYSLKIKLLTQKINDLLGTCENGIPEERFVSRRSSEKLARADIYMHISRTMDILYCHLA